MKAGTETGSLVNHILTESRQPIAAVGDAATVCHWTDREPATVIKVTRCSVTVQVDAWKRTDENGMSDCQSYDYERDPNGATYTFRKKNGRWTCNGLGLLIGLRERYFDFSF